MTAIVLKDNLFLGDGLVADPTRGLRLGTCKKIYQLELAGKKLYYACAGDCGLEHPFKKYLTQWYYETPDEKVLKKEWPDKVSFAALLVLPDKQVWSVDETLHFYQVDNEFYVEGCASDVLTGALGAGLNAVQALMTAIRWEINSGYPIQGFNIKTHTEILLKDEKSAEKYLKEAQNGVPTA